ncbi:PP2C family protein-serine/threonine phosphatase [Microbacterium sp. gxy059]|uniref:PP2C family protein-serine/threonine phosphatase n=1 Tax=Microbacterium sp. gxy059 TaxID=2957199 RepID=UPI003D95A733
MVFQGSSAAISHTGRVRSNNQDSGYSGSNLFVVADGMGGHAGGDVASAVAISRLQNLDGHYDSPAEAEERLRDEIAAVAGDLIEVAGRRPELAGLGTTCSSIVMVDEYAVIGHIGDSRIYLFRDDELTQITTDHTFVQRLVETGRITPEEARYHPRRSVLMRVLGDMDAHPEVDTFIMPTRPGDRWLLCSDGLSGVVDETHIAKLFRLQQPPARAADALLKQALDGGAPDNVTVVIVDVGGQHPLYTGTPTIVGSASNPDGVHVPASRSLLPTGWLHPARTAANEPTHFEPDTEYLEELIAEDRRRTRRRRLIGITSLVLLAAAVAAAGAAFYSWTQTRYYVGSDEDSVVIYRGIQQTVGPLALSTPETDTEIPLDDLPDAYRQQVEQTISARSFEHAEVIVDNLRARLGDDDADDDLADLTDPDIAPVPDPSPSPTAPAPSESPRADGGDDQ